MKIWFPTIRANTGADIFTINLAKGLRENGIEIEITWFPHLAEVLPYPLQYIKAPKNIDIIHTNSWYGFAFSRINIPTVISVFHWVHDPALSPYKSITQKFYHDNFIKRYEYSSIDTATVITAISEYTGNQLSNAFPEKNIQIINTGINTNLFRPKNNYTENNKFKLLFVGLPSKRKGFDLLFPIMEKLPKNIVLYYTQGDIKGNNNIIKLGELTLMNLMKHYQECDALLFPTRYEGFGYVVAEAMACAKPAISTNCSAIPELITNNKSGLLCPTDDVSSFVNSVIRLSKDKHLCTMLGQEARNKIVNKFKLESMIKKYIQLYKTLV